MWTRSELIVLPIAFVVMVGISVLLGILLKKKSEKICALPFVVITILLWIGEIVKQILALHKEGPYDLYGLPVHFCSTFFIWFLLAEVSFGSFRQRIQSVVFVLTLYVVVGMYFSPRSIISDVCEDIFSSFSAAHAFFFHQLIVLYSMLCIALGRFRPRFLDSLIFACCMTAYFMIACLLAHTLQQNYFNVLSSNIPFMESFRQKAGQAAYTLLFGTLMVGAGTIFLVLSSLVRIGIKKLRKS